MWNMPFSPATFAKMTPRARMHASLQGIGNSSSGVETRGAHGEFQSLIHNTLNAPTIGTEVTGGPYHIAPSSQRFAPNFARSVGVRHAYAADSVVTGSQVVRGVAGFGGLSFNPSQMSPTLGPKPTGMMNVRADLPPASPPEAPPPAGSGVQETTTELLQPGSAAPPMVTTQVDPATLQSTPAGLPLWQLGLGAAAVFGGIWFFTRKG